MTTIASVEAQGRLGELLARVANGESIAITEAGKAVAHLVPPPAELEAPAMGATTENAERPEVREVIKAMIAYRDQQKRTLGGLTFQELRDEGRRY